jgi:hypothetical protein
MEGTATQLHAALTERIRKPERDAAEAHHRAVANRDADLQILTAAKLREAQQRVKDIINSGWPKSPKILAHELRKAGPQLRKIGIAITWPSNNRDRSLFVDVLQIRPDSASHASRASKTETSDNENNGLGGRQAGGSEPGWEAESASHSETADGDGDAGEPPGSQGWEAEREAEGQNERQAGQTEYADKELNKQRNSVWREAWEAGEAKQRGSHTRPAPESNNAPPSEPENQKDPVRPTKRKVPL